MPNAISLLSGGLDSYLSTFLAAQEWRIVLALTFDYGQRAAKKESAAAAAMAKHFHIGHRVITLPWFKDLGENALTDRKQKLPQYQNPADLENVEKVQASGRAVWVPNRNGVMINIAAAFAESLKADHIITGFNREEAETFPDNGRNFVAYTNSALHYSTANHVQVKSFVQDLTKKEMAVLVKKHHLPTDLIWSCYEGNESPCGTCESCVRLRHAFG